jgi:GH25 family lysozyme M1 (1,4-beta-N-acetylmuramidase)
MIEGIDISDYQTVHSFHDVARSGREFVIAKATEAATNVQVTFAGYRDRVRSVAGLTFGAYHYLSWNIDPKAQAAHFLSVYTPQRGDLCPALDCEAFTKNTSDTTAIMAAFLEVVEPRLFGKRMLIYTYWGAIQEQSFATDDFSGHELWLAEPDVIAPDVPPDVIAPDVPRTWKGATIWQYGSRYVAGIDGPTDVDRYVGDNLGRITL